MLLCKLGVTFALGSTRMFSAGILQTYFPMKTLRIATTNYCLYLYLIVLSLVTPTVYK